MYGLCPQLVVTKKILGIQAKSQGRATPPKQNLPPKNGFPQPKRGQDPPERVVTDFKYLRENAKFYF